MSNKFIIFVFLGAISLMISAFYNGFPIVYSDTSTYIASGFELETPFDRPVTYGLFIRFFSLNGLSLWLVIFFQSLILSYIIFLMVKINTSTSSFLKVGLISIIFLSLFTSVSWTVSQIMPDIFTSIALMCIVLILSDKLNQKTIIFLYVIFLISVAMHMSHVLLFSVVLILVFILRNLFFSKHKQINLRIAILFILTITSVVTMGSAISKSKHVFFIGAMVEHGILVNYLNEVCGTNQCKYKLCAYKDSLPDKAYKFIWEEKSPFYKIGGWKNTKNEFNQIIYHTLTQRKYLNMHIKESLKATLQQLTLFAVGDGNGVFLEGTVLYERISKYLPLDMNMYVFSKQNQSRLNFLNFFNALFHIVVIISLLTIILMMIRCRSIAKNIKSMAIVFCIGIFVNAWDCGTFANAIDRLGSKMIWMIPFLMVIFSIQCYELILCKTRKE